MAGVMLFPASPYKDTRITVVSVIGKETSNNLKSFTINQLLLDQNSAFGCGTWSLENGSPISVDAFFSPESSILYLLVNGINDARTQSYLFASGRFRDKSFFEKMAIVEMESIHLLHIVFILSHLVILIEQSCRFDTEWLRTLKAVKYLRIKAESIVKSTLADHCPGCPKIWMEEGRLAVPKMLFAFHRSPLRADLGAAKRNELLEKLEKSLEGQLVSLLKHHKIVDKHSPESALACLPQYQMNLPIFSPKRDKLLSR
uniref:Nonsense-mediated mRNA decay factor SMG8 n=1 Tax=Ditylenchus dipsaci TaxID=166011 RepID=A0A915DM87_9BILA